MGEKVVASERNRDGVTDAFLKNSRAVEKAGRTYYELARAAERQRNASQPRRDGGTIQSAAARASRRYKRHPSSESARRYGNASSRGDFRFLSRVAVADGRLYVMTLKARADDAAAEGVLAAVAESFRVGS